uniref:protein phosphatase 1 regulatory subunit 1C n=1 Tax=Centroberyx gerrardi TaxID=166262 RepID=UPI003AAF5492
MSGGARRKGVLSRGASQQSVDSGGSVENQSADSLKLHKSGSGPEFLGLSRCAACYNPQGRCMPRWGGDDSESSSATDGSGPDCDWDSDDPESSSDSSCSSGPASAGTPQKPAAEQDSPGSGPGGVSEPGCDVKDGAGLAERAESVIMEPSSPKKIQFAVPPLQGQLDPQAAEHIRRRRPTPATLQIYRQPTGTDVGEQHTASGETQGPDTSQRKQGTYAPPTMKELQLGVEQHLLGAGLCETDSQLSPITAQLYANASLWANHNGPEEANGNEASLVLANEERGVAESNSSGECSLPEEDEEASPQDV